MLQKSLLSNAIFSAASGLISLLFGDQLLNLFGLENQLIFIVLGVWLLFFAGTVFLEFKKLRPAFVRIITIQDLLWVLGSIYILALNPFEVSMAGLALIAIVALIVLGFAIGQYVELRTQSNS